MSDCNCPKTPEQQQKILKEMFALLLQFAEDIPDRQERSAMRIMIGYKLLVGIISTCTVTKEGKFKLLEDCYEQAKMDIQKIQDHMEQEMEWFQA